MDAAQVHLMLNHLPFAGVLVALPILLIAWWRKSELLGRTGLLIVLFSGLVAIPTFLTGEPTEEILEHLPGISEELMKAHEEAAEKAIWLIGAAAFGAFVSLAFALKKRSLPRWAVPSVALLAGLSLGTLAWTNHLGGQISHVEIRKV